MLHILKCKNCNKYTLKEYCLNCNEKTISTKPAKFSPEDKWGKWRRKAKSSK